MSRILALAAVFVMMAGTGRALAQTVMVRNAPPGSKIELATNAGVLTSATADSLGDASLALPGARETSVQIRVDSCGTSVRVLIVSPGQTPPSEPGCVRSELWGSYAQRPATTFVVEMNGSAASVYVSQGPPPAEWLRRGPDPSQRVWGKPSSGLMVSAGVGLSSFSRFEEVACGGVTDCDHRTFGGVVTLGAEYWMRNLFAAYVSYAQPSDATAHGNGDAFHFDTRLHARMITVGGKVGRSVGPARLYAMGGFNHHEATSTTSQTADDVTITVDDVPVTIKGGAQAFGQKTAGWNWVLGGGVEAWVANRVAFFGELTRARLKADPQGGGEGGIDQAATLVVVGVRFRLTVK